ncbi:DUF305 domain-containing protein [Streptomyces sp. BH-SS-21]|uniref:DUF305 domain-containing protein n=2 Tax=Streptomyces TaxID=1883 RepID=A0A940Y513_9ACTN|nr:DUF305 domain-containing protein [Streptomyces liliiviolaceus]MBQ0850719.1 DUF305 domain-containing protein [Streptomyces liliiviolaceus]
MCAAVVALLVAGCTAQPATSGTSPGAAASRTSAFNATDTAWILLMIPMAERARQLTDLAPSRSADPAVATLAARTGSALRTDLARLRAALKRSGVPDTRPHEGHNMPGMVGLDTLDTAAATKGRPFDLILTDALRAHFTQSRMLCAGEQNQGRADEATGLAAAIARSTAQQMAGLDRLRTAPPATPGSRTG